jgi:hypothetical protein
VRAALIAIIAAVITVVGIASSPLMAAMHNVVDATYAPNVGGTAQTSGRLIGGIMSYARWPNSAPTQPHVMCVIGTPRFSAPMPALITSGGRSTRTHVASAQDVVNGENCDALFLGRMLVADRQRLIAWVRAKPILTITDDDPSCAYGAMFCLQNHGQSVNFTVNIDAVSRSQMRVDPRVLRIGREGAI